MTFRGVAALAVVFAFVACSAKPSVQKSSGDVVIVQIDELTLGSKDPRFHQYVIPPQEIDALAKRLKQAGARVVVIDLKTPNDPTAMAIDAVQRFSSTTIDLASLPRDASGQMKLEPAAIDRSISLQTAQGTQVEEHLPTFAESLSFSDAFVMPIAHLRRTVDGKLVYLGCTACGGSQLNLRLFTDARLADQLLSSNVRGRPAN